MPRFQVPEETLLSERRRISVKTLRYRGQVKHPASQPNVSVTGPKCLAAQRQQEQEATIKRMRQQQ
jgi:hypothetical protein